MSKIYKNGNIEITSASPHFKDGVKDGTFREVKSSKNIFSKSLGSSLFALFVLILFVISFSHYIRTGTFIDFSFKSLIERLAEMPDVSLSFSNLDLTIYADWGPFNFLRTFLNWFTGGFELIIALSGFGIQALVVIFFLLSLFFI